MGVAGELVGIVAREQVAQGVGFAGVVLAREQAPQLRLLRGDAVGELLRLGVELVEGGLGFGPLRGQLAQLAVGLRDGLFGLAQFLGGVGARFLGLGDVLLQRLDAALQILQFLALDVGRGGQRPRRQAKRQGKQPFQFFALPWLATAFMAAAMASWSPR
jgi:hypothetical protein